MITWRYCRVSNAHWHVTIQFKSKNQIYRKTKIYSAYKCKSKCLSSDIPESLADCTNFCNPSTGTHSIIISSLLGDSEISLQFSMFVLSGTYYCWVGRSRMEWGVYMTLLYDQAMEIEPQSFWSWVQHPTTRPNAPRLFCYHLSRFFKASTLGNCTFHDSNHLLALIFYCNSVCAFPFAQQL